MGFEVLQNSAFWLRVFDLPSGHALHMSSISVADSPQAYLQDTLEPGCGSQDLGFPPFLPINQAFIGNVT